MRDVVFPVLWMLVTGVILTLIFLTLRKAQARQAQEDEKIKLELEEGIRQEQLLPNGKPACVICKTAPATEAWPLVERSWLDRVTFLKDLYALTPRYSIRDGDGSDYERLLCRNHKRMCVQKWNELLSAKRTQVQSLFSQIESELSQMEGGAMLAYLRTQHTQSLERLGEFLGAASRPALRSFNDDHEAPISMPSMSTESGKEKQERTN